MIPIFFTFDERYAVPAAVTFDSLLRHADPEEDYALHVLHLGLPRSVMRRLEWVVGRHANATLDFHNLADHDFGVEDCPEKSHFAREILFKLCAATLFPQYDRILCSDVDVVFTGDVAQVFRAFADEDFYYAGVDTVLPTDRMRLYQGFSDEDLHWFAREINAGFLLFDLASIRRDGMEDVLLRYYHDHYDRLPFPEQDTLAACCRQHIRVFPLAWSVSNHYYTVSPESATFYPLCACLPEDVEERRMAYAIALERPVQIHYIGMNKPWNAFGVPHGKVWWHALRKSCCVGFYLTCLPHIITTRLQRYSLRRFFRKLCS